MTTVQADQYSSKKYNSFERFASYYAQIQEAIEIGPKTVLEVGVGSGVVANFLKRAGIEVITCDIDKSTRPDVVADVRELPFEDNSFDAVLAYEILEHIPFENFEKAFLELRRVSRKKVIISLPHACFSWEGYFKLRFNLFNRKIRRRKNAIGN